MGTQTQDQTISRRRKVSRREVNSLVRDIERASRWTKSLRDEDSSTLDDLTRETGLRFH